MSKRRFGLAAIGCLVVALGLSGCGKGKTPLATPPDPAMSITQSSTAVPRASTAAPTSKRITPTPATAQALVKVLVGKDLPIANIQDVTAENDPNQLLGRPNGYTSKVYFSDTRIKTADAHDTSVGSVDLGGNIEMYSDNDGATRRAAYIQQVEKDNPIVGTEYDFVVGNAVIRVSSVLTPVQAAGYKTAAS